MSALPTWHPSNKNIIRDKPPPDIRKKMRGVYPNHIIVSLKNKESRSILLK